MTKAGHLFTGHIVLYVDNLVLKNIYLNFVVPNSEWFFFFVAFDTI